jgi:MEMO1 family protein
MVQNGMKWPWGFEMQTPDRIREPAVAGFFYPDEATDLRQEVLGLMAAAARPSSAAPPPKALVVPHAGFRYSGPVAASAYAALGPAADRVRRVVLLGPSHRVPFRGIATTAADAYRSPLGLVPIDHEAMEAIADLPGVVRHDLAHRPEHSLEVQLPFLQLVLKNFTLVPLVVGDADAEAVADVLDRLWGGPETLIVISSDLSHYHDYATAKAMDATTCEAIESGDDTRLDPHHACGYQPLSGLLRAARRHGLAVQTLDLRNSGDTAGPRTEVVGYGAWALH